MTIQIHPLPPGTQVYLTWGPDVDGPWPALFIAFLGLEAEGIWVFVQGDNRGVAPWIRLGAEAFWSKEGAESAIRRAETEAEGRER